MPLNSLLVAPGSRERLLCCVARQKRPASSNSHVRSCLGAPVRRLFSRPNSCSPPRSILNALSGTQAHPATRRRYSTAKPNNGVPKKSTPGISLWPKTDGRQLSSNARRRRRMSRPAQVLRTMNKSAQKLYLNPKPGRVDLSYRRPRHFILDVARKARRPSRHKGVSGTSRRKGVAGTSRRKGVSGTTKTGSRLSERLSIHTILARYLDHGFKPDSGYVLTKLEQNLLHKFDYDLNSVKSWASCLQEKDSHRASDLFTFVRGKPAPPMFVLLLFLRRTLLNRQAIGVIMRYLNSSVPGKPLIWDNLKILSVRLLRHARGQWPETIPWIATLFVSQASAMLKTGMLSLASSRQISDITRFTNVLLDLLALPASINPMLAARYQENAQFQVLQFMASCTPAITVTQTGFRAITRNQLAHPKTTQERHWADLKGSSWPPWKENRTAMDEDKGYEFGASRASKILHQMYKAGYRSHLWEEMAEVYGGWDTDFSPTIQTRTLLPHVSSVRQKQNYFNELLWSARIRSTRTRREAWACFLAYEQSGAPIGWHAYLAICEKLHYPELERSSTVKNQSGPNEVENDLLPGDMKEVAPDPTSPLHHVYLTEPIPSSMEQLVDRMQKRGLRPSGRLLAFFLESSLPSFQACLRLLELAREDFGGGLGHLLSGRHGPDSAVNRLPGYLLAAFIRCLCRFGHYDPSVTAIPFKVSPKRHLAELKSNQHYLLPYAHRLLCLYQPLYRPAWTAYMDVTTRQFKEVFTIREQHLIKSDEVMMQYKTICELVDTLDRTGLGIDGRSLQHACEITSYAVRVTKRSKEDARTFYYLQTYGARRLRVLFNNLVGADRPPSGTTSDMEGSNPIPSHIPNPADLHSYVRALGLLRDYEGLYSFSTWLTRHHAEVTALANAQRCGNRWLFATLVALRAGVTGFLEENKKIRAPDEIVQLIKTQINSVEDWGGWPPQKYVQQYSYGRPPEKQWPKVGGK